MGMYSFIYFFHERLRDAQRDNFQDLLHLKSLSPQKKLNTLLLLFSSKEYSGKTHIH